MLAERGCGEKKVKKTCPGGEISGFFSVRRIKYLTGVEKSVDFRALLGNGIVRSLPGKALRRAGRSGPFGDAETFFDNRIGNGFAERFTESRAVKAA